VSDASPYVSLEDDNSPSSAPASGPYVSLEDEKPHPAMLKALPNKLDEANYQGWVAANSKPTEDGAARSFQTPAMGDRTVTVDPYGNGVDTDLRAIFQAHAPKNLPVPQQPSVDVSKDMLDRFQSPNSPRLTADSVYAKNQPAAKLGTWGKDADGNEEFHDSNWQPESTTSQIMGKAKAMASSAFDSDQGIEKAIQNAKELLVDPAVTGAQNARQTGNVLAGEAGVQTPESTAEGIVAAEKAKPALPEFRRAADEQMRQAGSAFGVLDAYISNPRAALASAIQGLTQGGATLATAAGAGALGGLAGGPAGSAVGTVAGAGASGYFDTYGQTIVDTVRASGVDMTDKAAVTAALKDPDLMGKARAAAMKAGVPAAVINALSFGVAGKVFKPVAGAVASKVGSEVAGKVAGVAAEAGTQGAIGAGGEAATQEVNAGKITDPSAIARAGTEQAALGGTFAALHAGKSEDASFTKADTKGFGPGKPFDVDDIPGVSPEQPKPTPSGPAQITDVKRLTAPEAKAKAQDIAQGVKDSGDIAVDHGDGGSVITVAGKPVDMVDSPKQAESIVADAKQAVDDRRIDDAQRKYVGEMTPEEMREELLTNGLTGIPNKRAYEEAPRLPVQASIDADSLKWVNDTGGHEAGDQVLQSIATALHEASPGNSFHISGDEFVLQGEDHASVDQAIADARERLAGAKVEFTGPDGDKVTLNGIGFSHGKGTTLAEADRNLQAEKLDRQSQGLRSGRGEQPPGTSYAASQEGLQADQDHAPAEVLGQSVEKPAEPTPAQAEAGNYKKSDVTWHGEPIRVENVKGQVRKGADSDGTPWETEMQADYGYFAGTKSTDGDGVDVLMGPKHEAGAAYVIDQLTKDGKQFDEPKTVVGVSSAEEAKKLYLSHYPKDWKGLGAITRMGHTEFKDWLHEGDHSQPVQWEPAKKPLAFSEDSTPVETPVKTGEETHSDLSPGEAKFVKTVGDRTVGEFGQKAVSGIVEARKLYEEITGTKVVSTNLKRVDELVERAIVETARSIVGEGDTPQATFDRLVKLYERQPSLNTRTSTSIENQAYSTPAPLAYLASDLGGINLHTTVLEPTAGNGMLLIAADPAMATVNELNPERAASLKGQGFEVTQKNAVDSVLAKEPVDVVIANPPFGAVKDANGESTSYQLTTPKGESLKTNEIDHAIVLKQLESMKPDGRAVLLIGGVNKLQKTTEQRSDAYNGAAKRKFFYHLYGNYNVVDHFTVAGELYSRQGAAWPIDAIVIHGVGKSALPLPAAAPPRVYTSYPDLKSLLGKTYEPGSLDTAQQAAGDTAGGGQLQPLPADGQVHLPVPAGGENPGDGGRAPARGSPSAGEPTPRRDVSNGPGEGRSELPAGASGGEPGREQLGGMGEALEHGGLSQVAEPETPSGRELDGTPSPEVGPGESGRQPVAVGESDGSGGLGAQEPYKPSSSQNNLGTLVPGNMRDAVRGSLKTLAGKVGSVDSFVAKELGYKQADVGKYFAAEQVDALALAIQQIKEGKGFIIGDQTGIGKGRVVAGVIRWAIKNGHTPIFVTEMPNLYGDIVRDLRDIGQEDIRPLMTNSGEVVPVEGGGEIRSKSGSFHNKILQKAVDEAQLSDHNMLFTTYYQMQTIGGKSQARHQLLDTLAPNAIVVLDESHNAGGNDSGRKSKRQTEADGGTSKTGRAAFVRGLVGRAKGVFYSSATYAKRPSVMDLYSKTDMSLAVDGNAEKLPAAIQAGGVPLQQVVASMLARSGQYIRRERSFAGVDYNTPVVKVDRASAEALSSMMLSIKEFDDLKKDAVANAKQEAKAEAKQLSESGATGSSGANSLNFTSLMHNLISQMLLSLKADNAADRAIEALKAGQKPVITLANTMGSFIEQYAEEAGLKNGDAISLTFKDLMTRYLESSRMLTVKDHDGQVISRRRMSDEELGREAAIKFSQAKKVIDEAAAIRNIPISPIDWIHKRLEDAGYKTAEITGRAHTVRYGNDGAATYKLRPDRERSTDAKVKNITGFNNGKIDAIVLNRSGSTGLSLHASSKFKDQRRRHMILAQAEGNIDTHMQMLGRVHRTGQVIPPEYSQIVADIPAEKRPAALLAKKMASLNANTTGARGGALTSKETVDFLNEYGDEVAAQLMADMPEVHKKLGEPLATGDDGFERDEAARKVTGRIPMLPIEQQEELYHLLESGYNERLAQADAMGENALEAKTLPLDAKTLSKTVLFAGKKSDSPFADGAYAETSDVKRVGKPFTAEEMRGHVAETLGIEGKPTLRDLASRGRRVMQQTAQDVRAEFHKYRTGEETKMLEGETKEAAREGRLGALDGVAKRWFDIADRVHIGGSYELTMADGSSIYGVVQDISRKKGVKMPTALGSWVVKFALADGSRQTVLPFSRLALGDETGKIKIEPRTHNPLTGATLEQMFDDGQSVSREKRVIVTGNLLAGFSTIKGGQIINFTDNAGGQRQGILMPRRFNLGEFVENAPVQVPAANAVKFFSSAPQGRLKSSDGAVEIQKWGEQYAIMVAKSKAEGGKYFLDQGLRNQVGDFVGTGNTMRAMVNAEQLAPAMKLISDKFEQKFETVTHRTEALAAGGSAIGSQKAEKFAEAPKGWGGVEGTPAERPTPGDIESEARAFLQHFAIQPTDIVVHKTMAEAAQFSKRLADLHGSRSIAGFFAPTTGKVHLIAENIRSHGQITGFLAHEYIGHFGLKAMFGKRENTQYQAILNNIVRGFPLQLYKRGRAEFPNGFAAADRFQRNRAAEEVLAYFAQKYSKNQSMPARARRMIDRFLGLLRDFARRVMGLPEKFDELWLKNVINGLESFLRSGRAKEMPEPDVEPAFGRTEPGFYSAVERAVETAKRDRGTGAEWEATLRNTPGVKEDEMKWLGLKDWLEGRGRVSKQEVADYVHSNKLELGERVLGMGAGGDTQALMKWMADNVDPDENSPDAQEEVEALLNDAAQGDASAIGELERLGIPSDLLAPLYDTGGEKVDGAPLYGDRAEPGGKNYRERLLTLPDRPVGVKERLSEANARIRQYMENNPTAVPSRDARLSELATIRDAILAGSTVGNRFIPSHFNGVNNLLVHVRHDDRVGPENQRVLHIAEIQSDWHQQGRQLGYEQNDPQGVGPGVPDAPFKTTWHELALKRMLRHAVENGYDAMSWDTGHTNANRYGLADKIDSVALRQGSGDFVAYGPEGERLLSLTGMGDVDTLAAHIGRPAAEKLLATEPENGWRKMDGLELDTGRGNGMKGFYDKMLPAAMSKIVKRFGGKVEPGIVGATGEHPNGELPVHMVHITPAMREGVMEGQPLFARDEDLAGDSNQDVSFAEDHGENDDEPRGPKAYELVRRGVIAVAESRPVMELRHILNPKDVSAVSKQTAQVTIPYLAELARQKDVLINHFQQFARAVDKLSPNDQIDITDYGERGLPQPIPAMQPMADEIRKALDFWAGQVQDLGTGKLETLIPDYWARYWVNPEQGATAFAKVFGKATMRGPMTFLKQRKIPLFRDGLNMGLKPLTINPLIATVMKIHEMQKYINGVKLMEHYKVTPTAAGTNMAVVLRTGRSLPDGWEKINDSIARISQWSEEEKGFIERGHYIMPTDAARLVNNMLGRSALARSVWAGSIRTFNNLLTSSQLGLSAFHLGFTTFDSMASRAALGFERIAHGEPLRAVSAFMGAATGPLNSINTMRKGWQIAKSYVDPSGATPFNAALVKFLVAGGGGVKMDRYFLQAKGVSPFHGVGLGTLYSDVKAALTEPHDKVQALTQALGSFPIEYSQKLWNDLRTIGRIYHPIEIPFELAGRIIRASTSIIMEKIVPLQKLGVFHDMAADWLRRNPKASNEEYALAAQSIWRSIDNRLGEMIYRNKFWDKTFKFMLHLSMRAVGWNDGTVEEIAGAPLDAAKAIDNMIRQKKWNPDWITHKMAYVMGMVAVNAFMSSMIQYMYTGEGPTEIKDLIFPRTGRLTKQGTPERLSLPMYTKDIWEYYHHFGNTVANKAAPWIGMAYHWIMNTNFYGEPLSNPDHSFWQQEWEKTLSMGKEAMPFSIQGQKHLAGAQDPGLRGMVDSILPFVGVTPAAGAITSADEIERRQHIDQETAYEKSLRYQMKQAIAAGDTEKAARLKAEIAESKQHRRTEFEQERRDRTKARESQATGGKPAAPRRPSFPQGSQLLDKVGPLIDSSSSRAEMAQKIHAAGYPALAGLIGSLPDTLRPQVRARIEALT
jgi:GGDEF domain-containing protein